MLAYTFYESDGRVMQYAKSLLNREIMKPKWADFDVKVQHGGAATVLESKYARVVRV
jgi:hypothetical protein